MNIFPKLRIISAPVVCSGNFSVEIISHSYHYICTDSSGNKDDISEKIYFLSFIFNLIFLITLFYLLPYLFRLIFKKRPNIYLNEYQKQFNGNYSNSFSKLNQQDIFHLHSTVISGDIEIKIINELKANRKINAVKICRDATGLGLKDAKDKVEEIGRRNGIML
jgi:hypothetical protein